MSTRSRPAVSVIIPTYNRSAFLCEAISSVLEQKEKNFELIVVDDGSTDDTKKVLGSFHDERLLFMSIEHSGVSRARNVGVERSSGEFVSFLDSDDLWLPKKLSAQLLFFTDNPQVAICQTEEIWVRNGVRVNPHDKHKKRSGWIFKDCIPLCIVSPSAVMMKRAVFDELGGFDEAFPACEDYDLWLRAALRYEIFTMNEPLIIKRGGHDDQLSKGWGLDVHRMRALSKILEDPMLGDENRALVIADILRRADIVKKGAIKRGNVKLVDEISKLVNGH